MHQAVAAAGDPGIGHGQVRQRGAAVAVFQDADAFLQHAQVRLAALEGQRAQMAQFGARVGAAHGFEGEEAFQRGVVVGFQVGGELAHQGGVAAVGPAVVAHELGRGAEHGQAAHLARAFQRGGERDQSAQGPAQPQGRRRCRGDRGRT